MAKFDKFTEGLIAGVKKLAASSVKSMKEDAVKDAKSFLARTDADLKRWTKLLASGDLSKDDFAWLVQSKKELAEMELLKQRGLAQARIDKFTNAVVDLVVEKAIDTFV